MAWIEGTGADLLVVNWSGLEFGDPGLLEAILEDALQNGLMVATVIESYEGRSPESVMADLEFLTAELGAHPAWFRSLRPTPWVDDAGRPVVLIASPELIEDRPELGPQDWIGVADYAHELGAVVLAVNTDPGWVEGGHFDGLVGGPVDGSFAWTGELPEAAWFVPTVTPGRSLERLGEPEAGQERNEGAFFEEQWMLLATSSHSIDVVVVVSFNGWLEGTQIEPATAEPPDPRYRTYAPLDPNTYLDLTRELTERVLGPRR